MPDVHFRYSPRLRAVIADGKSFQADLAGVVAGEMDCLDDEGNLITHDPKTHIKFPVFEVFTGAFTDLVGMDILAYDYPNRLVDMPRRLKRITAWVRDELDLGPNTVSANFIPIPVGGWVKS